jgi:hypothetical protein
VTVLSDQSKRSIYDAGLYDPLEDEDEVRTFFFFFFYFPAKADLLRTRPGTKTMSFGEELGGGGGSSVVVVIPKERHRIF